DRWRGRDLEAATCAGPPPPHVQTTCRTGAGVARELSRTVAAQRARAPLRGVRFAVATRLSQRLRHDAAAISPAPAPGSRVATAAPRPFGCGSRARLRLH